MEEWSHRGVRDRGMERQRKIETSEYRNKGMQRHRNEQTEELRDRGI
jgi:hypothetical protein